MIISYKSNFFSACCLGLLLIAFLHPAMAGGISLVSVGFNGTQSNSYSFQSDVSANGRIVAFNSSATNLVAGDTNKKEDIFIYDRTLKKTTRVSVDSKGIQANNNSFGWRPKLSADGRFVAFSSYASNLVLGDTNGREDVFIHDRQTKQTTRVSVDSNGRQANGESYSVDISADGRFVAFTSTAGNLIAGVRLYWVGVYVHDRLTKQTTLVSINNNGEIGSYGYSGSPSISADGRFVAFNSDANNLVADDNNQGTDIFIHDRLTKQTSRIDALDRFGNGDLRKPYSISPQISADGRFVAFQSSSRNPSSPLGSVFILYLHDRITNQTIPIFDADIASGAQAITISGDGRFVFFDDNYSGNINFFDRLTKKTSRVPISKIFSGNYSSPIISKDGRFITFSSADPLVKGDLNNNWDIYIYDRLLNTTQNADLKITVNQKPGSLTANTQGAYNFFITNNGPDPVGGVGVTHILSNGEIIGFTPSQGSCKRYSSISFCQLGSLSPGNSVNLNAVVKALTSPITQSVSVSGQPVDAVPLNNLITVTTPVIP